MTFNKKTDLSRWNRAGLSKFCYVDGNALTFLETLRLQLSEEFESEGEVQWKELVERFPEFSNESKLQLRKRLSAQYYDQRRDYAWEINRSFARSAHILGEYINAYANEAYLSTAVEWDNLRKLTALLDYRPSPPASAQTSIALFYKESAKENSAGLVEKGFAVKNKPAAGEPTVTFETRENLEGNYHINVMHLHDWNKNFNSAYSVLSTNKIRFYTDQVVQGLNIGGRGVLSDQKSAFAVQVSGVFMDDPKSCYIDLDILPPQSLIPLSAHDTTLYLQAEFVSSPLANGDRSAVFVKSLNVSEDELLFIKNIDGWFAQRVKRSAVQHVEFERLINDEDINASIFRSRVLKKQQHAKIDGGNAIFVLPEQITADSEYFVDDQLNKVDGAENILLSDSDGAAIRYISSIEANQLYYPEQFPAGVIEKIKLSEIRFAGKAPQIESGSWVVIESGGLAQAHQINSIAQNEQWFEVDFTGLPFTSDNIALVRGAFKFSIKAQGFNKNKQRAWHDDSSDSQTILPLADASHVNHLYLGRKMIVSSDNHAFEVELKDISYSANGTALLHLAPAFHFDQLAADFTRANSVINGNAVRAVHGETQPIKIVGSGDASKINQCFELASDNISWVSDATFSNGVRADLILFSGQRRWLQTEELSFSTPEDNHYQVKINQDNKLIVCFGDGKHGRRLPSGIDNIKIIYRDGYGEVGNLGAGDLVKIVRPHRLIEAFSAPLSSLGGAEKETTKTIRDNAPATVLTLNRAVSIEDFSHLAARHSMVWQARAFEKMPDRPAQSLIELVVVAAGGAPFSKGSESGTAIKDYLLSHAAPNTPLSVISYSPVLLHLELNIMVDELSFDKKQVERTATLHIKESLKIKNRTLGQGLLRSDITAMLEQVEGVENCNCKILESPYSEMGGAAPQLYIGDEGLIRKVSVKPFQLLFLDTDSYPLQIISQPYQI
jgi:predicted phage baseplate assembly protein